MSNEDYKVPPSIKDHATQILKVQQQAVANIEITSAMEEAITLLMKAADDGARIITTGMGKAGIIGIKMSATLASIGLPSFYVHPAESLHGDIGRISPNDVVIVFSNSGRTGEVKQMIATLHALNQHTNPIVLICSNPTPDIASDILVNYQYEKESCRVPKVPSTSTTLMLLVADILAIVAAERRGFDTEWFKARHPGGAIGQDYKKT